MKRVQGNDRMWLIPYNPLQALQVSQKRMEVCPTNSINCGRLSDAMTTEICKSWPALLAPEGELAGYTDSGFDSKTWMRYPFMASALRLMHLVAYFRTGIGLMLYVSGDWRDLA